MSTQITSVAEAVSLVCDPGKETIRDLWEDPEGSAEPSLRHYPFGLWFRGQESSSWPLEPGVFREISPGIEGKRFFDETSMFHHFRMRRPNEPCRSTFDWLGLMQHYGTPTRLLDWTESILVGLHFAVSQSPSTEDQDGVLFALNARKLNFCTSHRSEYYIFAEDTPEVAVRSLMASKDKLVKVVERSTEMRAVLADHEVEWEKPTKPKKAKISRPIAVFPRRFDGRMVAQSSVFTLHGGKLPVGRGKDSGMPLPVNLEKDNRAVKKKSGQSFLKKFIVPKASKPEIRRQLFELRIHESTLFPELEYEGEYLKREWAREYQE